MDNLTQLPIQIKQQIEYNIILKIMICINSKKNAKLLETFNNDQYSDIKIKTLTSQLNLVLGYLSIDSVFFDEVDQDVKEVNLSNLQEAPLIKILRGLYGDQVMAANVKELAQLYQVIEYLKITQYTDNIVKYIKSHEQIMENFQLIQFCFSHQILVEEIKQHHFNNKLAVLASTKNYLQLNKISQNTLSMLLIEYSQMKGEEADTTINSIIENYIGRNQLRPNQFFSHPQFANLIGIWQKFHHSISYLFSAHLQQDQIRRSQIINQSQGRRSMIQQPVYASGFYNPLNTIPTTTSMGMNNSLGLSSTQTVSIQNMLLKNQETIQQLQNREKLNNQFIKTLKMEIEKAKRALGKSIEFEGGDQKWSEIQDRLKRKNQFIHTIGADDYDVSLIQPPFSQNRKLNIDSKEVKTMTKISRQKIFP